VSFYTYSGNLNGIVLDKRNVTIDLEGLQSKRTYFTPVYETERQRSSRLPDQRYLLTWNPAVTMLTGSVEIECYTSDVTGTFEIDVQGLSSAGTAVNASTSFTVSNFNN
jgi:hypothetical protein